MGVWWYTGEQAKSWPTTEGTILTNDIISTSGGYQNRILFRYTVAGQDYTSDRIYNADVTVTYGNSDHVTDIANQFPVGNTADVYYNPENPELCALIPGANLVATILFIVFGSLGGLFFLIGFVLYNRFRNPKPGREPPSNPVWV